LTGHDAVVYNYTVKDIEKFGKLRDSLHGKKLNLHKELKKFRCMLESLPIEEESPEAVPYDELEHPESELLQNISDEFKKNEPVSEEIGNNIIEE
jgi:hypothetical protein